MSEVELEVVDDINADMIHENERYYVELGTEDDDANYLIINKATGMIDATAENQPQALIYAEQFNSMLANNFHKTIDLFDGFSGFDKIDPSELN